MEFAPVDRDELRSRLETEFGSKRVWCDIFDANHSYKANYRPPSKVAEGGRRWMKIKEASESVAGMCLHRLHDEMASLRSQIYRWVQDNRSGLGKVDPSPISGFGDRANDNWTPLLAIADVAAQDGRFVLAGPQSCLRLSLTM